MYRRSIRGRNRDLSAGCHVQLAHSHWNCETKVITAEALYNFGREDQLDREAIRRLSIP
jgi:hypothetical protein